MVGFSIQRLNLDSSWLLQFGSLRILIDPWLQGSEIDGFKWLNQQWHIQDPIAVHQLPEYDLILISQSYEDHCHLETLRLLPEHIPIIATAKAYKKLKKNFPSREIILLPDDATPIQWNGVEFTSIRPDKIIDPVYYGVLFTLGHESIFYCPHGFTPLPHQENILTKFPCKLLITTFTDFRLPAIMGGHVNPGPDNVRLLCRLLKPQMLVNTHDEQKIGQGLVFKLGKINYHETIDVSEFSTRVLQLSGYERFPGEQL